MLQRELMREQVIQLGEQILGYMEEHIIERGYDYFSNGVVFNIHVLNGSHLTSDVQGSQIYRVELDLNEFPNSTCTCPYSRLCKHMAATFFQIYSVFDNPKNFLQLMQQPRTKGFSSSMLYPVPPKHPKDRLDSYREFPGERPLTAQSNSIEWWLFLEKWTRNLSFDLEKHRLFSELRTNYQNVLLVTRNWPEELAQLFTVHAILYHLMKLNEYAAEKNVAPTSHWFRELSQTADQFVDELEGTLFYLDVSALKQHFRPYLKDTLAKVKELRNRDSEAINWILVCQLLWWYLLDDQALIEKESNELERLLSDSNLSNDARTRYQLLASHFSIVHGKDEEALQVWEHWSERALPSYLFYLKALARREEWQRLEKWLYRLEKHIGTAEGPEYRLITGIWRHTLVKAGRLNEWGTMLKRILPGSFHEYASYLFDQNRYQEWLDLQMSRGASFMEIPSIQTKTIEEIDATLMVPFFIREINRLIGERNRNGYKEAVKLLKKVRTCWNQAKQEKRWEQFIQQLAYKHNRLRAFQEELRRGNLLS